MKLKFNVSDKSQPDPFIFEDGGRFYIYVTAPKGVEAYSADHIFDQWKFEGTVATVEGRTEFWAPSVIKIDGVYYMYVSCSSPDEFEFMHVLSSNSPTGPFRDPVCLYNYFSIDSHAVKTEDGLFLYFSADKTTDTDRVGTRIFVDRMLSPKEPEGRPKEVIPPTLDEEIFARDRFKPGEHWHTVEGAFWFSHEGWQYLMYSGGCYQNDTYHIGYASAKTEQTDLTRVTFEKHTVNGGFDPVIIKNGFEEGTGHHSVIRYRGDFYAIYHGRDIEDTGGGEYTERRTARVCRLNVKDGIITAERFKDKV